MAARAVTGVSIGTAAPPATGVDPLEEVLSLCWAGHPAIVLASPPGGGKSYCLELVGSTMVTELGERVMVTTQTNAQAHDLAERYARAYPSLPVYLLTRSGAAVEISRRFARFPNVTVVDRPRDLGDGPSVVLSTTRRWEWVGLDVFHADLLVADEAWQMTYADLAMVAPLADRMLLVGDPGQIAPVTTAPLLRWLDQAAAPHRPAPAAVLATRGDDVAFVQLRHSRRLGPPTVSLVQPAFYPDLPFGSARPQRSLSGGGLGTSHLNAGRETCMVEVPGEPYGLADPEVAAVCAQVVTDAIGVAEVVQGEERRTLGPADVGVSCAHVVQVAAVRSALGPAYSEVMVDTAERWQGLERELMVVAHPLSGRDELTEFARDAGRLCVMLSRHRAGCVMVSRGGLRELLNRGAAEATRNVGILAPDGLRGWNAHNSVLDAVEAAGVLVARPGD